MRFLPITLIPLLAAVTVGIGVVGRTEWTNETARLGDISFYAYQFERASETGGAWWDLADDPLAGAPLTGRAARHPGLFEGVDLLLVAAAIGDSVDPLTRYHLVVTIAMIFNAAVAGAVAFVYTRSWLHCVMAMSLVTFNQSMAFRLMGHPHLLRLGWLILAITAFMEFRRQPSLGRALGLGLCCGLLLLSSFYFGYLLALVLASVVVVDVVRGMWTWRHVRSSLVTAVTLVPLAGLAAWPVLMETRRHEGAQEYFERSRRDLWIYGAELWQYLVPRALPWSDGLARDSPTLAAVGTAEGGHFPGYTILGVLAAYGLIRSRGWLSPSPGRQIVDGLLLICACAVIVSLAGGPGVFLFKFCSAFRCYGRAGMIALAAGVIATPLAVTLLYQWRPQWWARLPLIFTVVGATIAEAWLWAPPKQVSPLAKVSPWITWARGQDDTSKFVILPLSKTAWDPLFERALVKKPLLNAASAYELMTNLRDHRASTEKLTPSAVAWMGNLGYTTLVIKPEFVEAHPWLATTTWLTPTATLPDDTQIYRIEASRPTSVVFGKGFAEAEQREIGNQLAPFRWGDQRAELRLVHGENRSRQHRIRFSLCSASPDGAELIVRHTNREDKVAISAGTLTPYTTTVIVPPGGLTLTFSTSAKEMPRVKHQKRRGLVFQIVDYELSVGIDADSSAGTVEIARQSAAAIR